MFLKFNWENCMNLSYNMNTRLNFYRNRWEFRQILRRQWNCLRDLANIQTNSLANWVVQRWNHPANVCRPNGNSLAPKIVLSAIDSRDRYSAASRWDRRGPERGEIGDPIASAGRLKETKGERPYCSSTGPRLVSVITDRSQQEPFDARASVRGLST